MPNEYDLLSLLCLFILKHFIADFPLQSQRMINDKGTYGARGGIDHAATHATLTLIILLFWIPFYQPWGLLAVAMAVLDGLVHYHIDWAKMNLGKGLTPDDRCFWTLLGVDQLLHYLTYILIIGILV